MGTFRRILYKNHKKMLGSHPEEIHGKINTDRSKIHSEILEETLQELLQTEAFQFNS